ncbi:MAG: CinA family protein [Pseudomonadales bacterium]
MSDILHTHHMTLISAESCTGGLIASYLTSVPGSSEWFEGAFVTYRISAKVSMLGVKPSTLDRYTAVSEPVAKEMAEGALAHSQADISVSVTGVAGPGGGNIVTPVGTVWFGWAVRTPEIHCIQTSQHDLKGNRDAIRNLAVRIALEGVRTVLG